MIKHFFIFTCLSILIGFASCETDKSRISKSEEIVNTFVSNISFENNNVLYKVYPNFSKVKSYWKIKDFKIVNSSIDADKTVTIIGKSTLLNDNIMFQLKQINGNYVIVNSKGLSSDYNSYLYQYCKKIGCLVEENYDVDVAKKCSEKKEEYELLVMEIKENIEHNFILSNNNLKIEGGGYIEPYISGDLTMKNTSRFSIPMMSYQIYYHFTDERGNILFTLNERNNLQAIQYGQSITENLMEQSHGFRKIHIELKLTSTAFIEKIIAENITGNNCIADANLL